MTVLIWGAVMAGYRGRSHEFVSNRLMTGPGVRKSQNRACRTEWISSWVTPFFALGMAGTVMIIFLLVNILDKIRDSRENYNQYPLEIRWGYFFHGSARPLCRDRLLSEGIFRRPWALGLNLLTLSSLFGSFLAPCEERHGTDYAG